ncbi:unnamed protein product [Ambrosiozyma monospora]|uniref:Unnamed protein product n=1 Tax=Ambrosiozyma monospora TaxID=43982 RepID=A0A9W6Z569_AMBMO|nr:unnamed protein product [Ambrosiozyma monospora]
MAPSSSTPSTTSQKQNKQSKTPNSRRLQNKIHIKHAPPKPYSYTEGQHTIYIKSQTPYMSALKKIEKMIKRTTEDKFNKNGVSIKPKLKNSKLKFITVKGMGKSMLKVLNLGLHFKGAGQLRVEVYTKTIGVLDEFKSVDSKKNATEEGNSGDANANDEDSDEDGDEDDILKKRNVSSIELKIYV